MNKWIIRELKSLNFSLIWKDTALELKIKMYRISVWFDIVDYLVPVQGAVDPDAGQILVVYATQSLKQNNRFIPSVQEVVTHVIY